MIKRIFILVSCLVMVGLQAQVGINTTTPNANAVLHVNSHFGGSNYGGFMPPKVTLAERNSIPVTATDDGLMLYVLYPNGDRCLELFNGASLTWANINCFGVPPISGTVFFESMGNVSTNTGVNTHHANLGFDNSSTCTFSSTTSTQSQVRITLPSSDVIPSASGGGNIFFSPNANRNFIVDNIDVSAHSGPLVLRLLIHKSTTASNGSELTIEYSTDGLTWTDISINDLPTGAGTATWYERTLSTNIPNTISNLRFIRGATPPEFRIDDIEIISP